MAFVCVVCNSELPIAIKRRVIHPCSEANADVHEFFVNVVAPGYTFHNETWYSIAVTFVLIGLIST